MVFFDAERLFHERGNSLARGDEVRDHDTDWNRPDTKVVEDAPGEDEQVESDALPREEAPRD